MRLEFCSLTDTQTNFSENIIPPQIHGGVIDTLAKQELFQFRRQ